MPLIEHPLQGADGHRILRNRQNSQSGSRKRGPPALSIRLAMVADLLPDGNRLIDIGTDHAYLPITAVTSDRFQSAVAADIRPGPITVAERNIRRFGCADRVRAILSDGLAAISSQDGDVIAMAGLGGLEMIDILAKAPSAWPVLVLQPQKSAPVLRRFLAMNGYAIRKERLCLENDRLYLGLLAEKAADDVSDDPVDHIIGPVLRKERPPLFQLWLEKQRIQVLHAIRRGEPLEQVLAVINELLHELKHGKQNAEEV